MGQNFVFVLTRINSIITAMDKIYKWWIDDNLKLTETKSLSAECDSHMGRWMNRWRPLSRDLSLIGGYSIWMIVLIQRSSPSKFLAWSSPTWLMLAPLSPPRGLLKGLARFKYVVLYYFYFIIWLCGILLNSRILLTAVPLPFSVQLNTAQTDHDPMKFSDVFSNKLI